MSPSLTPAQALCLQAVTFWVRAVRSRKGEIGFVDDDGVAWSAITAEQCASFISERMLCDLSPKTCQASLRRLEQIGLVVRQKKFFGGWKHTYHYALPDRPEVRVALIGGNKSKSTDVSNQSTSINPSINQTKNSLGSIKEADDQSPKAQSSPQETKPDLSHLGVVRHPRRSPEDEKASVNENLYKAPNNASDDHGVISHVELVPSRKLLGEIEKATLNEMGVPDIKINPAAYLNFVMSRKEKQSGQ